MARVAGQVRPDYVKQAWLRPCEAALVAGCSRQTIYHRTSAKDLEVRRNLGGIEISHQSLLKLMGRI